MSERSKLAVTLCILLAIALLSYFVVGNVFSEPANFKNSIDYLGEKQEQIFKLSGTTVLVSVAVGMIPGDATTPLAEKITDIGSYFLIALCAVFLEKYLLTLTGLAAFKILIPAACGIFAFGAFLKNHSFKMLAVKILLLALIITAVVPTSIKVSQVIEKTSEVSIEDIKEKGDELVYETFPALQKEEEKVEEESKDSANLSLSGLIDYLSNLPQKATEAVKNVGTGITENVKKAISDVEAFIRILLIYLATMIVTSCLVPFGVFWLFTWIGKALLGINLDINVASIRSKVNNMEYDHRPKADGELPSPDEEQ
ncbi:MAG: hypothetical protein IKX96_04720 [Firmicutes bacterium]|nr:hypothetical protein [Bacillota bacterium]